MSAKRKLYECAARRRLIESDRGGQKPLVVGDEVEWELTEPGRGVVQDVYPRRTKLSRTDPHDPRIEHVIVANVDQVLIVSSVLKPRLNTGIIDRYIIAGERGGLLTLICINKLDLAREPADYEAVAEQYRRIGYKVALTSARTRLGIEELKDALKDKCTVLAGHSGVGKSSLINAVQPGLKLKTGEVKRKGQHVTASVSLLELDFGGFVVDTPGIRELLPWDVEKRDVAQFFPEIWKFTVDCKMPDCLHLQEPDCAVRAALERGDLPESRYVSYANIVESIGEWITPRDSDVERPSEQVAREKRDFSRRALKQRFRRQWLIDFEEEEKEQ